MDFSVAISIYKKDKPEFVTVALDSIINQTVKPTEIVLVVDGPIPGDLIALLQDYDYKYPNLFNIIRLSKNQGLGNALRLAIQSAKYDLIARMDSDDISMSNRFEKQLKYFEEDSSLSIVGGNISEFIDSPDNIVGYRKCPLTDSDIKEYMKSRCALNHVTVMFRKSDVLRVGNYQDWFWNEDYYLWIRMVLANCRFANLSDVLVNVRTGKDMYARRGGMKYFKSEKRLQQYMWEHKMINYFQYVINVTKRLIVQVLLPNTLRGWVFRTFARS